SLGSRSPAVSCPERISRRIWSTMTSEMRPTLTLLSRSPLFGAAPPSVAGAVVPGLVTHALYALTDRLLRRCRPCRDHESWCWPSSPRHGLMDRPSARGSRNGAEGDLRRRRRGGVRRRRRRRRVRDGGRGQERGARDRRRVRGQRVLRHLPRLGARGVRARRRVAGRHGGGPPRPRGLRAARREPAVLPDPRLARARWADGRRAACSTLTVWGRYNG